ncbi:MAG: 4a-hydroxytetrahydrobiopterin dehydratase [Planctomycetota bacterium]|nr:4a-hydroxytetrahydrobiopterin dehydratase [Planctomycetota bacterium]
MSAIDARCQDGASLLEDARCLELLAELHGDWSVEGGSPRSLARAFVLADFRAALDLVNAIGAAAEEQNHHPDLALTGYRNVTVTLSTHDAGGLTMNDFVLAKAVDALAG